MPAPNTLRDTSNLTIIRPRERKRHEWFELEFDCITTIGCSFVFRCTENGELLSPTLLNLETIAGLKCDTANYAPPVVRRRTTEYIEYAQGRCPCGELVELRNSLYNECDVCGYHYNLVGQRVIGPHDPIMEDIRADEAVLNGRW